MLRKLVLTLLFPAVVGSAQATMPANEILHELRAFAQTGRVLYVAAHPDDENTRLITYFARGRGYRTAYLSATRGDGGQNLIGPELGATLGVIRTQELLAARRIDGGVQFFTRATDFGYSKTATETLSLWDRSQVLADYVRVIRTFRPDVIITRFSPEPGGTHGQHTASAQLAVEAFRLAADPAAFREELGHLPPWSTKRIFWNAWAGRGTPVTGSPLAIDIGGYEPLLGESHGETAARSRTMHKSQGFGAVGSRGVSIDYLRLLAGEPAESDPFDGIDTGWSRYPGGSALVPLLEQVVEDFDPLQPSASVPALLELRRRLAALPPFPLQEEKQNRLDRLLFACLGLHVLTTAPEADVVAGETVKLSSTVILRSDVPLKWQEVRIGSMGTVAQPAASLQPNESATTEFAVEIPVKSPPTHPYWLRTAGTAGMYAVADPGLIGQPENPPVLMIEHLFEVGGEMLRYRDEPVQVWNDPVQGEQRQALRVIPPVSLNLPEPMILLAPGATATVEIQLSAHRPVNDGALTWQAPAGWQIRPERQDFAVGAGATERLTFEITAPAAGGTAMLEPVARVDGRDYGFSQQHVRYAHLPEQLLQPPAQLRAVAVAADIRGRRVGYLPGAGDRVAEGITRLGYEVSLLEAPDLTPEALAKYDAVVLGIRALNTREDLDRRLPALFEYARQGGTVIVQYNTSQALKVAQPAPYPLRLSRGRVTEEDAAVSLLAPEHPALNQPNRITPSDFSGWVQERGLYFPEQWDEAFTPLLAAADTGEPPQKGALLVARHGDGWYVYTGLSFFRQLPEGVPGAYRLLANLLSLSAADAPASATASSH